MAARQAPLSLGSSRQAYWSGLPFPSAVHACIQSRFSRVQLYVTAWTAAHQAPLSTEFSRQEYWSGLPFPSPRYSNTVIFNWELPSPYIYGSRKVSPRLDNSILNKSACQLLAKILVLKGKPKVFYWVCSIFVPKVFPLSVSGQE